MLDDYSSKQGDLTDLYNKRKDMILGLCIMTAVGVTGFIVFFKSAEVIKEHGILTWVLAFSYLAIAIGIFGLRHIVNIVMITQRINRSIKFAVANIEASLQEKEDV